jgi:hypothetical protein
MGLSLLDLGQFNDWNEKIEWLSMQKYVTINWWGGVVGLYMTHAHIYAPPTMQTSSMGT